MTSKTEEDSTLSDMVTIIVGAIFLTVLLLGLIGIAFTYLFNTFVIPVFMEHKAPISVQQGIGLFMTLWLTTVALRGSNRMKTK
jgi:hypothetical protein